MKSVEGIATNSKVDIIVINWNSGIKTLSAIEPYFGYCSALISCKIIVVDNASLDKSTEILRNKVDLLIENKKNMGFAHACNQAFQYCNGDYILLLNPDTISKVHVLENLVSILQNNTNYAISGPQQLDESGNIIHSCLRFPTFRTAIFEIFGFSKLFPQIFISTEMKEWDHKTDSIVDHVIGSYYLVKKTVIDETGFMDNNFFLYLEDVDLSKRINEAGYSCFYSAANKIFHERGGSGDQIMAKRLFYSLVSRKNYWKKHLGKLQEIILTMFMAIELPLRLINLLFRKSKANFKQTVKAYFLFGKFLFKKDDSNK